MRLSRTLALVGVSAALIVVQFGCGNEISTPSPTLDKDRKEGVTSPGFVCSAQKDSWVTVHGKNFTPLVVGSLEEGGPDVNWPAVRLTRVATVDGETVENGMTVEIEATSGTVLQSGGSTETNSMALHDAGHDGGDGASSDGSTGDTQTADATDTGSSDTAGGDTGSSDTGTSDSGAGDTGNADTGPADTSTEDTGGMDEDTGMPDEDTGTPDDDTGTPGGDTAVPDTGAADTGIADTGPSDAGEATGRHLVWLSDTKLRFRVSPQLDLAPGTYDITVVSSRVPKGSGSPKTATAEKAFGVLGPPSVEEVAGMSPVCVEQKARTVTVTGASFMRRGDRKPTVQVGDQELTPTSMSDCSKPKGPFGNYELCGSLKVELPQGSLLAGSKRLQVENFEPAGCISGRNREGSSVRVLEPPKVFDVSPDPICSAQTGYTSDSALTISGEGFVAMGGDVPTVEIGGFKASKVSVTNCSSLSGNVPSNAKRCSTLRADVPAGAVGGGSPITRESVSVTNPGSADCSASGTTELTTIQPPAVDEVEPQPIVGRHSADRIELSGSRFAQIDGARPKISVTDGNNTKSYTATALQDCREVEGPGQLRVNLCSTLEFVIPAGDFTVPQGQDQISLKTTVTNPSPLSCSSSSGNTEELTVIDPPELSAIRTTPICTETQAKDVVIEGSDFAIYDGKGPMVAVGMQAYRASKAPNASCQSVASQGSVPVELCDAIQFTAKQGGLRSASLPVTVYNPEPVGGHTTASQKLRVVDAPSVQRAVPELVCLADGARQITFDGQDFLRIVPSGMSTPPTLPTVQFNQTSATVTDTTVPNPSSNCRSIAVPGRPETFQICSKLRVTVESNNQTGLSKATIENPAPADCTSRKVDVTIDPKPSISSVQVAPQSSCQANGYRRIVVKGSKLLNADGTLPSVSFDGTSYQAYDANGCSAVPNTPHSNLQYCSELIVYGSTSDVQGTHDVAVENPAPSGCTSPASTTDVTANCP